MAAYPTSWVSIGVLDVVAVRRRRLAQAWAALGPPAPPPGTTPGPGARVVTGAVVAGLALLAWATAAARLPHGAPAGVVLLGVIIGSLNGLLAAGLVLVYRATRVINFAQGALGAFAAVLAFELIKVSGWPWLVAVVAAVLSAVALAGLMELGFLRRLRSAPRTIVTVATIGIAQIMIFLQLLLQPVFERSSSSGISAIGSRFPSPLSHRAFSLFPLRFTGDHVLVLVVVPLVLVGLHQFLNRSWTGMGIRAVAENDERASMLGWPVPRLSTVVWCTAGLLSALAALLQAPITSFADTGSAGPGLILRGLAAAAIGRMTNLPVTVLAAVGLGVVEQLVFFNYSRAAPMDGLLLGLILVAFLLQSRTLTRSLWQDVSSWRAVAAVRPSSARGRALGVGLALAVLAILAAVPLVASLDRVRLVAVIEVYGMVGLSLVVLTGWSGQISLGQWAVAGVGGFATAWLTNHSTMNFVVILVLGGLAAAAASVVLGLPSLRIRGIFAGITTLAFAIAASEWFFTFKGVEPDRQVSRPYLGWLDLSSERSFSFVVLAALVVCLLLTANLRRSRAGRLLVAVRDNESCASSFGVSVIRTKVWAFAVAGFIAGLAGGVYVLLVQRADPTDFNALNSLFMFAIVVIGGLGSIAGALLGALYVQGSQYLLPSWGSFLATGIGMLALLMVAPGGLSQLMYDARDRLLKADA